MRQLRILFPTLLLLAMRPAANAQLTADSILPKDSAMPTDSLPYTTRVRLKIDSLLQLPMFQTSQVGLMVYDLDADSTIYAHNERQLMRPASTMKLLTAITALDRLGTKHRFRTGVYCDVRRDSTRLRGNIYVKGGMDPTLNKTDVERLADGIRSLGADTIWGRLVADRSFKDDNLMGEGWCWDDDNPVLSPLVYMRKDNMLDALREQLKARGITVMLPDSAGKTPTEASLVAEHTTNMEPVLTKMMKVSDNLYAEAMLYQIGATAAEPSTAKAARQAEKDVMRRAGLEPSDYRLADGSGLSLYNYLSAECEVMLLRFAYGNKAIYGALCQSLPCAGVDGTLSKRMRKEPLLDNVRAKTGTLEGVSALAGYCYSPDHHRLAFCIINQGVRRDGTAQTFQDNVCEAICK